MLFRSDANSAIFFIRDGRLPTKFGPFADWGYLTELQLKALPFNEQETLPEESATLYEIILRMRAKRPYAPTNLLMNGTSERHDPTYAPGQVVTISWIAHNRGSGAGWSNIGGLFDTNLVNQNSGYVLRVYDIVDLSEPLLDEKIGRAHV